MGFLNELDMTTVNEIKSQLNVIEGNDYKNSLVAVSHVASEILQQTLGPYASTTILDDGIFPYTSKDGWSLVKRLSFNNVIYQTLFGFIRNISFSIIEKVGDGTTTAIIAANAFIEEMTKVNLPDVRQAEFVKIMNDIKTQIVERLEGDKYKKRIDLDGDFSDIRKIAYISSNGSDEIADMIQDIYQKTKNPNIYVGLDYMKKTSYEIQTGYKFDCNLLNMKMYANTSEGYYSNRKKTYIAMFDHSMSYHEHKEILETIIGFNNQFPDSDLIVMAPHFDDVLTNIMGTLITNMRQKGQRPNFLMVQVPVSSSIQKEYYKDLATLLKAIIIDYSSVRIFNKENKPEEFTETFEDKIEEANGASDIKTLGFDDIRDFITSKLGSTINITITNDSAVFQDYDTTNPIYKAMLKDIDEAYSDAKAKDNKSATTLNKKFMDVYMRKIKITGNMGAIRVGAVTELEQLCLKDQIDDSVLACRSAYENGFVLGLNMTTLHIIEDLIEKYRVTSPEDATEDMKYLEILKILKNTFLATSKKVMQNKYNDGTGWLKNTATADEILNTCISKKCTFNIVTEDFEDWDNFSVINSVRTDIEILNAMTSILALVLTSSQMLSINHHYDKKSTRTKMLQDKTEEYSAIAEGFMAGIEKSGKSLNIIND